MKRCGLTLGLAMVSLVWSIPVWAGGVKNYVASYGLDSNACTIALPCRSFAHAVDVTDAGGEVIVLDTGGYGSVTITKSISLIAPVGMYASVTVSSGGNGITVNAGAADRVLIKGLTIKGLSNATSGIRAYTVGTLIVDGCSISGFSCGFTCGEGIAFFAPNSNLILRDSELRDNHYGVGIYNSSGTVEASIDHVHSDSNGIGFDIAPSSGTVIANITNSTARSNTTGFSSQELVASGQVGMLLEQCIAANNSYAGVVTYNRNSTSATYLSNCVITGNATGVLKGNLGTIYTRQNNTVTDSIPTLTPFSAQ